MLLGGLLAFSWLNLIWNTLGVILVFVCLLLILVILIQDSKGAGLTSAFGAGPGGESLLGARMQRDIARYTTYLGIIFAGLVIAMGLLGNCRARFGSAGAVGARSGAPAAESTKEGGKGLEPELVLPPAKKGSGEAAPGPVQPSAAPQPPTPAGAAPKAGAAAPPAAGASQPPPVQPAPAKAAPPAAPPPGPAPSGAVPSGAGAAPPAKK